MSARSLLKVSCNIFSMVIIFLFCLFGSVWGDEDESNAIADMETVDDLSLGELLNMDVDSVAFFKMSARESPGTTYSTDLTEAAKGAFRTPEDVLYKDIPGVTTARHDEWGTLIGIRGIQVDSNAKTIVMLDGQQINQRMHFGYTAGLQTPLIGDLKRMDVTLGPGAIVHGSGAINGFINFVPKNGTDNPGFFVNTEYGSEEESHKMEAGHGLSYGENKDLYLYAGFYGAKGYPADTTLGEDWGVGNKPISNNTMVQRVDDPSVRASVYWNHNDFSLNLTFRT